ncbi:MAG: ATP synthase subunit I [Pyrinomonadaceae bacterium]
MQGTFDHVDEEEAASHAELLNVERRLFRLSCVAVALMVALSLPIAPWRVTSGLLVGGLLSLFNYYWLKTSVAAIFKGDRPRFRVGRYALRYLIIAFIVFILHTLDLISLVAALFGLCAFVAALLAEALGQITLTIFRREDY